MDKMIQSMVDDINEASEWTGLESYMQNIEARASKAQIDAWCAYAGQGADIVTQMGQEAYDQVYTAGVVQLYENWARRVIWEKCEALEDERNAGAQAVALDEYNAKGMHEAWTTNIIGMVLFFVVVACLLFAAGSFLDKAITNPSWANATHEPLIWKWLGTPPIP